MEDLIEEQCMSNHLVEKAVPQANKENANLELFQQESSTNLNYIESLKILLKDAPEIKIQKIANLKTQIKSGEYKIHEDVMAEQLMECI